MKAQRHPAHYPLESAPTEKRFLIGVETIRYRANTPYRHIRVALLTLLCVLLLPLASHAAITIHCIGDSQVASKPPEETPQRGWGQVLDPYFISGVTVNNSAVGGRSSRSFLDEGRWDKVRASLKTGDWLFIQFGGNDEKIKDPKRYTDPEGAYRENLMRFIREARSAGVNPVLVSNPSRRTFDEKGRLKLSFVPYVKSMKTLAAEQGVPFIDLNEKTAVILNRDGAEGTAKYYMLDRGPKNEETRGRMDNTHFTEMGAMLMASLIVEEIIIQKLPLAAFLRPDHAQITHKALSDKP